MLISSDITIMLLYMNNLLKEKDNNMKKIIVHIVLFLMIVTTSISTVSFNSSKFTAEATMMLRSSSHSSSHSSSSVRSSSRSGSSSSSYSSSFGRSSSRTTISRSSSRNQSDTRINNRSKNSNNIYVHTTSTPSYFGGAYHPTMASTYMTPIFALCLLLIFTYYVIQSVISPGSFYNIYRKPEGEDFICANPVNLLAIFIIGILIFSEELDSILVDTFKLNVMTPFVIGLIMAIGYAIYLIKRRRCYYTYPHMYNLRMDTIKSRKIHELKPRHYAQDLKTIRHHLLGDETKLLLIVILIGCTGYDFFYEVNYIAMLIMFILIVLFIYECYFTYLIPRIRQYNKIKRLSEKEYMTYLKENAKMKKTNKIWYVI